MHLDQRVGINMNKIIEKIVILLILIGLIGINVFAVDTGKKVGKIYSTNIMAYVDGVPIHSYNLGGKTGIVCEELKDYGFEVKWNGELRVLFVTTMDERPKAKDDLPPSGNVKVGKAIGNIYSTDIVTFMNGKRIPSYNIGGRTIILLEDLNLSYGFTARWNGEKRTISAIAYRPGDSIDTDLGKCQIAGFEHSDFTKLLYDGVIALDNKAAKLDNSAILANAQEYLPLLNTLDAFNISYSWEYETNTLKMNIPDEITLREDRVPVSKQVSIETDDALLKINMRVELDGVEHPIIGSANGTLSFERNPELPVVYKGIVYFPADAIADYLDMIYGGKLKYATKKDDPETWDSVSKYIMTPISGNDELAGWMEYTKPEIYDSGRGGTILYPYGVNEPIKIKFTDKIDKSTINHDNIAAVRRFYSKEAGDYSYEIISDQYRYDYDEAENLLTMTLIGEGPFKDDHIVIFVKNISDCDGNKLENIYRFSFIAQ